MKKLFCILLVALLLFNTTSCVQQTSEKTEKETSSSETTKLETNLDTTPFGRYDPPIEITYAKVFSSTDLETLAMIKETEEDNRWTRYYEEELGVKLKLLWSSPNYDDFNTKLSLSVSSGTIPDYIPFGQNYNTIYQFAETGLLADLTDIIDEYASDGANDGIRRAGEEAFYPATINDRIYAIPQIIGGENQSHCFLWLRKDWLDNLGLKPPKTIEELDVVMDAFVNKDPDGNGEADTFGLGLSGSVTGIGRGFFYSYHAYPLIWVEDKENRLIYGSVMDTAKPALQKLREYYSKNYIPKEFYTLKNLSEMIVQGKVGGYIGTQTAFGTTIFDAAWEFNNNANWVPYVLPTSDGKKVTPVSAHNSANFYGMSANCKHPEVLVKFLNLMYRLMWDSE
jgi:putative aldouronate transport system substrate-binding protein